jgi:hypothetical protein
MMTSTTNLIQLKSNVKDHIKGEYKFPKYTKWNPYLTKEMADCSAMKSYLQKCNLHYFTFTPNSQKPVKAVIRHLPPGTPAEDISDSLEDLGFNVINVRQMTATQTASNGQTHVEQHPLFLVALTRNIKSQEIFELNRLNHIIIKVELYRAQTGLTRSATAAKTLAISGRTASNPFIVCGAAVATCIGNALRTRIQNVCRAAAIAP